MHYTIFLTYYLSGCDGTDGVGVGDSVPSVGCDSYSGVDGVGVDSNGVGGPNLNTLPKTLHLIQATALQPI